MAWSIFSTGGGTKAAVAYAAELLKANHLPETATNVQFVYDWEKSEGGGGANNPLNVGTVTGLASSGSQYGGGANNYPSISAEIKAVSKELNTPTYAGIKAGLAHSTYRAASTALWRSRWAASHYGYGNSWHTTPLPHTATLSAQWWQFLSPGADIVTAASGGALAPAGQGVVTQLTSGFMSGFTSFFTDWALRAALVVFGLILVIVGLKALADQGKEEEGIPVGQNNTDHAAEVATEAAA